MPCNNNFFGYIKNGVCFNSQRFNGYTLEIFIRADQKTDNLFRRGGGNRLAAFLFAPGQYPDKRGGNTHGVSNASVVSVCHVRKARYAA